MNIDKRFPLLEKVEEGRAYKVDPIMPGWIEAHSGRCFGSPTLVGRRLPCSPHFLEDPGDYSITQTQALVAAAFFHGMEWQRSRKRRQRMKQAVEELWDRIRTKREK